MMVKKTFGEVILKNIGGNGINYLLFLPFKKLIVNSIPERHLGVILQHNRFIEEVHVHQLYDSLLLSSRLKRLHVDNYREEENSRNIIITKLLLSESCMLEELYLKASTTINLTLILEALKTNKSLRILNISLHWSLFNDSQFRNENRFGEFIAQVLRYNNTLTNLEISGLDDYMQITQAMKENKTIKSLSYPSNRCSIDLVNLIGEMLEVNTTLEHLETPYLKGFDLHGTAIEGALRINSTLNSLKLVRDQFDHRIGRVIGDSLRVNRTLESLSLAGSCEDHNDALKGIMDALKTNQKLLTLDCDHMRMNFEVCRIMCDSLKQNKALAHLRINYITAENPGSLFGELLAVNLSLLSLRLGCLNLFYFGASAIADGLRFNSTLIKLDLSDCDVFDFGAISFAKMLLRNKIKPFKP